MAIEIKPSDLYYKYPRKKEFREHPKFTGKPDPTPFDRDDQYEVIPMLQMVMDSVGSTDGAVLEKLEEIMIQQMPTFIHSREEVFDFLLALIRERLE
ncbi:hypothetical protein SAMN05660420_02986 [Desulfuromusa kysingii]|uniref:Uncharacterized protein n=1 Tax=Desulfuromusa kysingii TaxID=37625 RepID=A0A1H4DJG7_9BACT|nr:hypothetical protein [Desulfuromusa kysingii]SEA72686.1 hypothetical protein SAMN05660420_02986 [Desulfuromusa kysingii]